MTAERYLLTDSELIIEDAAMGISIRQAWHLPAAKLFYPDGSLQAEMFYDQGLLHGPSTWYSQEQKVLAQTWYVHGKKTGKAKFFYLSGNLASVQRFKAGVCDGLQEYWYEDNACKSVLPFKEGVLHGEVRLFWESGQIKRSAVYSQGVRHGWDRIWNPQGVLIDEGEFDQGKPKGVHQQWYANGKMKEELSYHTPIRYDSKEWDDTGILMREGKYAPDLSYTERTFIEPSRVEVRKGYWDGQRLCWK